MKSLSFGAFLVNLCAFSGLCVLALAIKNQVDNGERLERQLAVAHSWQGATRLAWSELTASWPLLGAGQEESEITQYRRLERAAQAAAARVSVLSAAFGGAAVLWLGIATLLGGRKNTGIALAVLAVAGCCFVLGAGAPMLNLTISTEVPWLGEVVLSRESKSLWSTSTGLLQSGNAVLGVVVVLFCLIVPVTKMLILVVAAAPCGSVIRARCLALVSAVGKWSFVDVFVVAVLVAILTLDKQAGSAAVPGVGLYFFLSYCLLTSAVPWCFPRAREAD